MNLSEMQLPLMNSNEDLETISDNLFKLLFDVNKFEIRPESRRDKGIDFSIEIKKDNRYLNFRGVVQLKATEAIQSNIDGSYSLSINTSNLNYILNSGLPAFYVLYVKPTNTFYFEEASAFIKSLEEKNSSWATQSTHTLRFIKMLDATMADSLFEVILKRGQFQRKITEKLIQQNTTLPTDDKLLIDVDFNVTSDAEIRGIIEKHGIMLDNEGRWSDIISLHKKGSGSIATTAKYNFFVGIANFHTGNLSEALSSFKAAIRLKDQLSELLECHLRFFDATTRYSIGIFSEEEYLTKMAELENHPSIGLYIKLSKAKKTYLESNKISSEERFNNFYSEMQDILNDANATASIKLEARCEIVLYEGYRNNIRYITNVSGLNASEQANGPNINARINYAKAFAAEFIEWYNKVQELQKEALNTRSYFTFFHAVLNEVRITYEFCTYRKVINLVKETQGLTKEEMSVDNDVFAPLLKMLDEAFDYYSGIDHVLNKAATLAQKYEVVHFLGKTEEANEIMTTLENLVANYDLSELTERLSYLKEIGPTHVTFEKWLNKMFEEKTAYDKESKIQADEMTEMDQKDFNVREIVDHCFQIELFPLGRFQFPKDKIDTVFQTLNITSDTLKEQFVNMFAMEVVPIANVYNNPILREGPLNGYFENSGRNGWANLYRVRKIFHENKFYKIG